MTEPPDPPRARTRAVPVRSEDLRAPVLPDLRWDGEDTRSCLAELYEWAERFAGETIGWYLDEKAKKAKRSQMLRTTSAVLATLGGIVPLAALAADRTVLGNVGFVLLGLAAGCVAYDRYFGYSSAWLRYVSAAMNLRAQLTDFQLSWTREMAVLGGRDVTRAETHRLVELVRTFISGVNRVVQDETHSWLVEFHMRLQELESKLHQTAPPAPDVLSPPVDPHVEA